MYIIFHPNRSLDVLAVVLPSKAMPLSAACKEVVINLGYENEPLSKNTHL
jgi:hypothetical protein